MKIVSVKLARVRNLGNYENERLEVEAEMDEDEDLAQTVSFLRDLIEANLQPKPGSRRPHP